MNERGLVDVPENAVRDEPIAFGLTGIQLGICGIGVVVAAVLNLLPVWEPVRLVLVVLGAGSAFVTAALPIRGEPAYRWLVRYVQYRRHSRCWNATLEAPGKSQLSERSDTVESSPGESRMDDPFPPSDGPAAGGAAGTPTPSPHEPPGTMVRPRLRVVPGDDVDPRPASETLPPVPHLLARVHVVCFVSFAGGVGKTTLAVEAASLVGSRARYRTLEGDVRPLKVLLVDAARTNPAAALRLGLDPDSVSRLLARYDWPDAITLEKRAVETRFGATLLTLPPRPMQGLGPDLPFGAIEAAAILDAAEHAGFQLVVVDLGSELEDGHRHLIGQAATVLGVVTPRVEALPDVLRIASYVRALGAGRKLGFVANRASDLGSLAALADEEQVPIVATIPTVGAFDSAGDRGVPAWTSDQSIEHLLEPLATATWSLFPGVPAATGRRVDGLAAKLRQLLHAQGGRR